MRLCLYIIIFCAFVLLLCSITAVAIEDSDILCEQVIVVHEPRRGSPREQDARANGFDTGLIGVYYRMWLVQGERAWYAIRGPAVNDITVVLHRDGTRWLVWKWKEGKRVPSLYTSFPNTEEGRAQSRSLWRSLEVDRILAHHGLDRLFRARTSQAASPVPAFNLFAFPPDVQSVYLQQTTLLDPDNSIQADVLEWYTAPEGRSRVRLAYHLYADGQLVYQEYTTRLRKPVRGDEKLYPYLSAGALRSYSKLKVSLEEFVHAIQSAGWGLHLTVRDCAPEGGNKQSLVREKR